MISLEGKRVLISGGGSGIGRSLALRLASAGAELAICGRRQSALDQTCREAAALGMDCLAVRADISLEADVDRLIKSVFQQFSGIDILVNNAGIAGGGPIHTHEIAAWDRILATNLRGPFLLARAVLPYMRSQKSGHILMVSSESGLEYYPEDGAYGVSKHALNALAEYIQVENQEFNIRVDTICPGMVITEMTQNEVGLDPEKCLQPEDIADLAVWLLSRRTNIKIGRPVLIQTMLNPWE